MNQPSEKTKLKMLEFFMEHSVPLILEEKVEENESDRHLEKFFKVGGEIHVNA
jgi:hypothetical protein